MPTSTKLINFGCVGFDPKARKTFFTTMVSSTATSPCTVPKSRRSVSRAAHRTATRGHSWPQHHAPRRISRPLPRYCRIGSRCLRAPPRSWRQSPRFRHSAPTRTLASLSLRRTSRSTGALRGAHTADVDDPGGDDPVAALHDSPAPSAPPINVCDPISISAALCRPDTSEWIAAIDDENLQDSALFTDGKPALERVPRSSVPEGALISRSMLLLTTKSRSGKKKARHVVGGSKRAYKEAQAPSSSSPTCHASTVLLCLAMVPTYGWSFAQFDVVAAYLLASPRKVYFAYFPPGFADYLRYKHNGTRVTTFAACGRTFTATRTRARSGTT